MSDIDPLKVMRNPETLQAYRQHQRALWAAGHPWLAIGVAAIAAMLELFVYALFHGNFRTLHPFYTGLMLIYCVCFAVAAVRIWLYRRAHPLVLPEAPSRLRKAGKIP